MISLLPLLLLSPFRAIAVRCCLLYWLPLYLLTLWHCMAQALLVIPFRRRLRASTPLSPTAADMKDTAADPRNEVCASHCRRLLERKLSPCKDDQVKQASFCFDPIRCSLYILLLACAAVALLAAFVSSRSPRSFAECYSLIKAQAFLLPTMAIDTIDLMSSCR